jgi:hypothetical protein
MRWCRKTLSVGAVVSLLLIVRCLSASACARPIEVDDAWEVQSSYLILKSSISTYVIDNDHECFELERAEFHGELKFFILNRFPEVPLKTGYVLIKSLRKFSVPSQKKKIKVSRGDGWFNDDGSPAIFIDDEPLSLSIQKWNEAHSSPGSPKQFKDRLGIDWHAYADESKSMPSSDDVDFWQIPDNFDAANGIVTNYLVRFGINTDPNHRSYPPFKVYLQNYVQRIELNLEANIGSLNDRQYVFQFK